MNDNDKTAKAAPEIVPSGAPCPMCGKPAELKYRPFCSKRCADLDLSRWLNGVYAIPARETDPDDDEET
ncbi:DNA gyrase inhibitor YacG [uncultured Alsobacter sp.]|uniref:DNA gyrase inhibitor YacG n=1 Tax=uncultured Alsobacter sp. TaxID=1748258 RepID=UPI0025E4A268|nr:DNA gyrase inhibitor YacG [uncultured Alsobacter sp.]